MAQEQEHFVAFYAFKLSWYLTCTCAGTFSDHFGAIHAFDAFDTLSTGFSRRPTRCPCQLRWFDTGPPNPFGLPRAPTPKGTFVRFLRLIFFQGGHVCPPGRIARFARFCATKCYYSRAYINVGTVVIAFARFFCTVCPCQPAHLIGSPNPLVSRAPQALTQKGAEQAPEFPPARAMSQNLFFSPKRGLLRIRQFRLSVIKLFLRQKGEG